MASTLFVLNGPNLNALGKREPGIYGGQTLADIEALCKAEGEKLGYAVEFRQSNHEGDLVDWIHEAGDTAAPQCVAKGMDAVALKIRALAEEHGVPVIEDPPLARALYAAVELDDFIPPAHYEAVAKLIGFIMQSSAKVAAKARHH